MKLDKIEREKQMSKKTKVNKAETQTGETQTGETPVVKKAKVKKVKVQVPLTAAQQAAQDALEKANKAAREEMVANSKEKIAAAEEKIAQCEQALKMAKAERKAINTALGIKGVFGGKRTSKLTFVQAYPEDKGAPQARAILEIVKAGGPEGVAREKVVETMKTAIDTKMDRSRLLSFYATRMAADGVVALS